MRSLFLAALVITTLVASEPRMEAADAAIATELLNLVNAARAKEALAPIALEPRLTEAAQRFAEDLAARRALSHTDRRGGRPPERFLNAGYRYAIAEEAVAAGQKSCVEVVAAWLASPSHRPLLLDKAVRDAGIGYVFRADDGPGRGYRHYWVIDLGLAAPAERR